jgi:hypothetical protein
MAPLLQTLSSLEVEPLEVLVHAPESEQDSSLDTLTTAQGEIDVAALLTGKGAFPVNDCACDGSSSGGSGSTCCCCCCPCCCV